MAGPDRVDRTQFYPSYTWPLEHRNHDGVTLVNYVDEDPSAGFLDYRGGAYTYDTHRGTDIALNDFRGMDRGSRIIAAAPGTVTSVVWANQRDRNCAVPDNPTLNYIEVSNGDGTYTYYYHLRANSVTVNLGESVTRGEMLGLVGSSGYSYGPHLHFEAGDYLGGPYVARDPWGGPDNPNPSLWYAQEPYAGDDHLRVNDSYIAVPSGAGGNLFNADFCTYFEERISQPAVTSIHEQYLSVVLELHALTNDAYRIELRRPNQSVYASVNDTLHSDLTQGIFYYAWYWDGYVTSADYGAWTAVILQNSQPVRTVPFVVGASTVYGPRFVPRDGRSYRVSGATQRDTMRVSPLGGAVTYALLGAPGGVSLTDSILTITAASAQSNRSAYFQVIATDASARRDTAWFHLVDPGKPQAPVVLAADGGPAPAFSLALGSANPAHGSIALRFALPTVGHATLAIYDLAGRRVSTLLDEPHATAGAALARVWDGRDSRGGRTSPGVYFARLTVDRSQRTCRFVKLE